MVYQTIKPTRKIGRFGKDEQDWKAVRVFAMDFSKAFDCVNHELLSSKLVAIESPYCELVFKLSRETPAASSL